MVLLLPSQKSASYSSVPSSIVEESVPVQYVAVDEPLSKAPSRDGKAERAKDALCIALNVSSAVGVVMANKMVFSVFNFRFGTLLTVVHFAMTAVALHGLALIGVFRRKHASILSIVPLSLSFCGFVVLTNLSLQYNSVGFYQMAKVLTTPCVATIQALFYRVSFRQSIVVALAVTCVGVVVATLTEVSLSPIGLVFALSAVLVTAVYQVVSSHVLR